MKKWKILIPSLVTAASMPLIGLVGCKDEDKNDFIKVSEYHEEIEGEGEWKQAWLTSPKLSAKAGEIINFKICFTNWDHNDAPSYIFISNDIKILYQNKKFKAMNFKVDKDLLNEGVDYEIFPVYNWIYINCFREGTREFNTKNDWTLSLTIQESFEDCYLFLWTGQ